MGGRGSTLAFKHTQEDDNILNLGNPNINVDWNDPESDYHSKIFNELKKNKISTRKSTDDIDDKVLERQQKQVLNLSNKYKKILENTTISADIQFGSEKLTGGTLGYCAATLDNNGELIQRICLDKRQLSNYDKVTKSVTSGVTSGHFVPINTMFKSRDYLVTHELGHAVENSIMTKIAKSRKIDLKVSTLQIFKTMQKEIFDDVIKIYKNNYQNKNKHDKICLSDYSKSNYGEWFAETFTNLQLSDNPAPIAKALEEYLRRYK